MERLAARHSDEGYDAFAYAYDQALGRPFFDHLKPHLQRVAAKYLGQARTHLDLACGTALLMRWFQQQQLSSVGVDLSVPMLQLATKKGAPKVVAGDLRRLPIRGSFDVVTSMYDSLNHFLERDDLLEVFRAAHRVMHSRSTFWFDMNHTSAYTRVWSIAEPFVAAGSDYRLAIHTSYSRAEKRATGWVEGYATINGQRIEIGEVHYQRAWTEREIGTLLKAAGLRLMERFRFDPFGSDGEPVKLFFIVAKK